MKSSAKKSPITVGGLELYWTVRHWPGWCWDSNAYLGLSLLIETADKNTRDLVIEYPFREEGSASKPHRQRPKVSKSELAKYIEQAIQLGWDPNSRGKPFVLHLEDVA